jgi:hypothetical protein
MGNALADVVMHVNEKLNEETMRRIEQGMRQDAGVISVGHRPDRTHLVMVVYDSDVARATSILHPLQAQGLHAQVIG